MTGPAPTIRRMKNEDYPLVYELWIRCTGFTMRDIDDCKDAIKTCLERNPNPCFVAADDGGRIIGAILAGHDGSRAECPQTTMPATISGNVKALQSVMIWFIENCRCNNEPSTMPCTSPQPTLFADIE